MNLRVIELEAEGGKYDGVVGVVANRATLEDLLSKGWTTQMAEDATLDDGKAYLYRDLEDFLKAKENLRKKKISALLLLRSLLGDSE